MTLFVHLATPLFVLAVAGHAQARGQSGGWALLHAYTAAGVLAIPLYPLFEMLAAAFPPLVQPRLQYARLLAVDHGLPLIAAAAATLGLHRYRRRSLIRGINIRAQRPGVRLRQPIFGRVPPFHEVWGLPMSRYRRFVFVHLVQMHPVWGLVVLQHVEPQTPGLHVIRPYGVQHQFFHEPFFVLGLDVYRYQQCNHEFLPFSNAYEVGAITAAKPSPDAGHSGSRPP